VARNIVASGFIKVAAVSIMAPSRIAQRAARFAALARASASSRSAHTHTCRITCLFPAHPLTPHFYRIWDVCRMFRYGAIWAGDINGRREAAASKWRVRIKRA